MLHTILLCCVLPLCSHTADTLSTHQLPEASIQAPEVTLRHTLSATTPQQVVTSAEATALGIDDVADALRLMNGVSVRDYGGLGGMKTISVRHLSATHTAVLYDGVPVSNCQAGQIDVSRFPVSGLSQMRLAIGSPSQMLTPASVEPASAMLTMNTQVALDTVPQSTDVQYGSWNTLRTSLTVPHLWVSYRHTDGNYPFTLTNGNQTSRLRRNNSRLNSIAAESNHRHSFGRSDNQTLDTKAYVYHIAQHLPGSVILYNNVSREEMTDENVLLQARYRHTIGHANPDDNHGGLSIQALAKYNLSHSTYFDGIRAIADDVSDHHFRYTQHEGFLSWGIAMQSDQAKDISVQAALVSDLTLNTLQGTSIKAHNLTRLSTHTAMRASLSARRLRLNGSLLYTSLHDTQSRDLGRWIPSAALSYRIAATDRTMLFVRLSARDAFRVPSFNDLYYSRIGNQTLRPETTHEYNAGISLHTRTRSIGMQITVDAYRNYVRNKIVAVPGTFSWRMYNYGTCKVSGIEASADVSALINGHTITMSAGYSYADCHLPYVPLHSGNGSIAVTTTYGTTLGYFTHWNSTRYSRLEKAWRYRLAPYSDHNISITQRLGRLIALQLSCQNIADKQYEIIQFYPMPGRSFHIAVKANR